MLRIDQAEYTGEYMIHLTFNNGKSGQVNLKQTIFNDTRPIFSGLKALSDFKNFRIDRGTLVWPNDLDFAPEYLFYLMFKDDPDLQQQFKAWGYAA